MATLGNIAKFDGSKDNILSYLERVSLYFDANGIVDAKQVSVLLTIIGAHAYDTLRSLDLPKDKSFLELSTALRQHYSPKPLVIGERFRFYQRYQKPNESIADFAADLRRLSITCEFGNFLDQALRDRFVCGVRSESIQKKLLAVDGLTMAKAQTDAQGMESADKHTKDFKGNDVPQQNGMNNYYSRSDTSNNSRGRATTNNNLNCYRCGRNHDEKSCKFREAECHKCGK